MCPHCVRHQNAGSSSAAVAKWFLGVWGIIISGFLTALRYYIFFLFIALVTILSLCVNLENLSSKWVRFDPDLTQI